MSENCTFCRIARHQAPAYVVTEDEHVIVFLSRENHPLIVPKRHIPDIYALDEATGTYIMRAATVVARAMKRGLGCDGIYLTQANEPAAGQEVLHFHLHVYPRWHTVDFRAQQTADQVSEADKQETLQKITASLREG